MPVPVNWVTAPRGPALDQLESGVRTGVGAVLIGSAGVGKTSLARDAAGRLAPDFPRVDWVRATASAAVIPFAAFEPLLDVPESGKTAEVLQTARETLGDGRLLIVDDAHLLDPLSAALVYQLAVGRRVRLLVTATVARNPVPPEIAALWQDALVTRIDLEGQSVEDSLAQTAEAEQKILDDYYGE